jgi:hypothetical protein
LGEQYRSQNSSLCNLLHSSVTYSLVDPDIFFSTLPSNALSHVRPSVWERPSFTP